MEGIDTTTLTASPTRAGRPDSFADLGSEDFLKLLVTQLTTQDPLEPTGNEELLRQIASIRDIELSTTLTESLGVLTAQQRFASAATLIGHYVTGSAGADGVAPAGIVTGVRFERDGRPMLQLANGTELALENVNTIIPPLRAGEALIGQEVVGLDRRDPSKPEVVEGVVTAARMEAAGEVILELDSGQTLRLRDYVSVAANDE
ncbi:MAG: flagellar hook assembly protein FlgD [Phycisphaerae bacterium]